MENDMWDNHRDKGVT